MRAASFTRGSPLALLAVACSFDSGGVASAGASGLQETSATMSAGSSPSGSSGESSAGSAGSAGSTVADTSGVADSGVSVTDATSPEGSSGGSTGNGPGTAHLQHGTHETCTNPMWCVGNYGLLDPIGGPSTAQECFVAPFATSQITAIQYSVGGVAAELYSFSLEVYAASSGQPAALIAALPMTADDATVGDHEVPLVTPIAISTNSFCVGFRTTGFGLSGALGFASSEDSQVVGESWFTSDDCNYPAWSDMVALASAPKGNWCISVDIESTE